MKSFYNFFVDLGNWVGDWLLLLIRLFWGILFALTGWGKLQDIEGTASFFSNLGIPFPQFHAELVGSVELVCGICLALGFLSRFITIPLIITMLVALFTAHVQVFSHPADIVKEPPFNYLLASLLVFCFGAGRYSLDYLMCRKFGTKDN